MLTNALQSTPTRPVCSRQGCRILAVLLLYGRPNKCSIFFLILSRQDRQDPELWCQRRVLSVYCLQKNGFYSQKPKNAQD